MFIRTVPSANPVQAKYHHSLSFSDSEGQMWTHPIQLDQLYTPSCDGSLLILPPRGGAQTYTFLATSPTGDGAKYPEWRHNLTVFSADMEADGNLSSGSFWRPYTTIDRGFAGYSSMLSAVPEASNRVHVAYDTGNESAAEGALDPSHATAGGAVTFRTFTAPTHL